jgi:hypothetical protein
MRMKGKTTLPGMTEAAIRRGVSWQTFETAHYLFLFDDVARGLCPPAAFGERAERRLGVIAGLIGLARDGRTGRFAFRGRIPYFVHDPRRCRYGNVDFGGVDVPAGRADTFYQHEEAHAVLGQAVGSVPSLFNEGFASYAQSPRSGQNHRIALAGLRHGELAALAGILEFRAFWDNWRLRGGFVYPQAGSFVAHLMESFGHGPFLDFCARVSQHDGRRRILRAFSGVFGLPLAAAEKQWTRFLLDGSARFALRARPRIGGSTEPQWVQRTLKHIARMRTEGTGSPSDAAAGPPRASAKRGKPRG